MRLSSVLMCVAVGVLLASVASSAGGDGNSPSSSRKSAARELPAYTPEREAAALQFVEEHHPELSAVLERLKKLQRPQYEQAIREISQSAEKLTMVKASDETLYGLMLEAWTVNSRAELLAAKIVSAEKADGELEAELKQLLYLQVDLQRRTIEHNRMRTLAALQAMETNIKLLEERREEFVERRLRNLTRTGAKKPGTASQNTSPSSGKTSKSQATQ